MAEKEDIPVLRRKAGARRAAMGLAEMTPQKAMRLALARAGDTALGVPVTLTSLAQDSVMPEGLSSALPDPGLILRLDGPGGAVALVALCPQAVAAAIEAQTLGKVTPGQAPDRKATATDALLLRDFAMTGLDAFAALAADCHGLPPMDGYGFAGRLADARSAAMTIQDAAHLHLVAEAEFGGAKAGRVQFVLPARSRAALAGPAEEPDWSATLERVVMGSPVRLNAVLCRVKLPLSGIADLQPGQLVPLARATLDGVELRAADGRRLVSARLGRSGAMRAVRLRLSEDGAPQAALSAEASDLLPRRVADAPGPQPGSQAMPDPGAQPGPGPADDLPVLAPLPMAGLDLPE